MSSTELQQIELNIKHSKAIAEIGEALGRLMVNRDFKKVISEGYFEQEAIRLVHLKSDQNMQSVDSQKSIMAQIESIGMLRQYFQTVQTRSAMAVKAIESDENMREELLAEDN